MRIVMVTLQIAMMLITLVDIVGIIKKVLNRIAIELPLVKIIHVVVGIMWTVMLWEIMQLQQRIQIVKL